MAASPKATALLDDFAAEARRTVRAPQPDQVHNLRVASRKFTQALAVLDPHAREIEKIRRSLKRMIKLAGPVRDCDITIKLATKLDLSKRLRARLLRRRRIAEKALRGALERWQEAEMHRKWLAKVESLPTAAEPHDAVWEAVKRLFKRGAAAEESDKKLHPLRIAAKKLRYTLDLLDTGDAAHREQIKELQNRLGDINDYETALRIAAEESAGKRMMGRLRERHQKKVRSFHRYWNHEFAGKRRKREWKAATLQPV